MKRFLPILVLTIGCLLLVAPPIAHAQCVATCPAGQTSTGSCTLTGGGAGVTCGAGTPAPSPTPAGGAAPATALTLPNPLGTANVPIIVGRIIRVLSGGAGMIALFMFVYGGFQWLTSGGNAEKIKKGQAIILWSLIGLVVMFSSYIAARYIIETLVPTATR